MPRPEQAGRTHYAGRSSLSDYDSKETQFIFVTFLYMAAIQDGKA